MELLRLTWGIEIYSVIRMIFFDFRDLFIHSATKNRQQQQRISNKFVRMFDVCCLFLARSYFAQVKYFIHWTIYWVGVLFYCFSLNYIHFINSKRNKHEIPRFHFVILENGEKMAFQFFSVPSDFRVDCYMWFSVGSFSWMIENPNEKEKKANSRSSLIDVNHRSHTKWFEFHWFWWLCVVLIIRRQQLISNKNNHNNGFGLTI